MTPELGGFEGVRVRAALWRADAAHAQGCVEALPPVEVPVKDPDHWVSVDTSNKASHKAAGVGGLALVSRQRITTLLWCTRPAIACSNLARGHHGNCLHKNREC